jgi:ketosteroid isomerase-like protein
MLASAGLAAVDPVPPAPDAAPVSAADKAASEQILALRKALIDSYNKGDIEALLANLDDDVVVTWQNAEVCRGKKAVRDYYDKMMSGPTRIVTKITAEPRIDDRHIYGDWAVSWGNLHDEYVLEDGSRFRFDSRFTATVVKRGDAWKVASFHASVSAFENPILGVAVKKVGIWAGIGGAAAGLLLGVILGRLGRKKAA